MSPFSDVEWAEAFAALGGKVFPWRLIDGQKVPCTEHGHLDAVSDPFDIELLAHEHPERSGWGYVPAEGQIVIDLDVKGEHDGVEAWELLNLEEPEASVEWRTRSGGRAILYACDGELKTSVGGLGKGIDTRGPRGWQAIPGSKGYSIERWNGGRLGRVPSWVPETLGKAKPTPAATAGTDVEWDLPPNVARARSFLASTEPAIEGQGGNAWTFKTAGVVKDFGISPEMCHEIMMEPGGWNDRCEPPWDDVELAQVIRNAYSYGKYEPGAKALRDPEDIFGHLPKIEFAEPKQPEPEKSDNPFRSKGISELAASPKIPTLIEGLVIDKSVGMLYGPPKEYKGFIAASMAVCVATGTPFHGRPVERRRVVIVTEEDRRSIHPRIQAFCDANGIEFPSDEWLRIIERVPNFSDMEADDLKLFAQALQEHPPGWLIVDHMGDAMATGNVNDPNDARAVFDQFVKLQRGADCAVTILHHQNADGNMFGSRYFLAKSEYVLQQSKVDGDGPASRTELKWAKGLPTGEEVVLMGQQVSIEYEGEQADMLAFKMENDGAVEATDHVAQEVKKAAQDHRERPARPDPTDELFIEKAKEVLAGAMVPVMGRRELARDIAMAGELGDTRDAVDLAESFLRSWRAYAVPELREAATGGNTRAKGTKRWEPQGFRTAAWPQRE
ncbi:MAG: AAA family ATPase [Gammaproteobacteria bacterium]|jgi:hypothetical protein|nr:AAA family ATPase [Gammaproteobacteria bacterium]